MAGASGAAEALEICSQMALGIALPRWIIGKDLARLSAARLARAWNDASVWSAVVTFGPLSLLVHFTRTRRSLLGFLLGVCWAAADLGAALLLGGLFQAVVP
jgi:hypothetical protein